MEGKLIWITGLAASGKTEIAKQVYNELKKEFPNTVHLDGDWMRKILSEDKVHDLASRYRTAGVYARLASFLTSQGMNVIVSTISLIRDIHNYNKENNKYYFEILVDTDRRVLEQRKPELYNDKLHEKDGLMGVHHSPEYPQCPSLILKNNTEQDFKLNIQKILQLIKDAEQRIPESVFEKSINTPEWDYSEQAASYASRPNYSILGINKMCELIKTKRDNYTVADIGAGTGNLSVLLKDRVGKLIAIEPNKAMRDIGMQITKGASNVIWTVGTGEDTGLPDESVDVAAFGSSFNTTDRAQALKESYRILKPGGYFVCMWNNRDLTIPTQKKVEEIIKRYYPDYSHGTRREDQTTLITESGLFTEVQKIEQPEIIITPIQTYIDAWRSVKNKFWDFDTPEGKDIFDKIVRDIREEFKGLENLELVYSTRIWIAKKK
ncbi:MAG: adenylyl-sulfate kinase [archaeon]